MITFDVVRSCGRVSGRLRYLHAVKSGLSSSLIRQLLGAQMKFIGKGAKKKEAEQQAATRAVQYLFENK